MSEKKEPTDQPRPASFPIEKNDREGYKSCGDVGKPPVRTDVLARLWGLAEYHGRTLSLPLVFSVFSEFGIEKQEAKGILRNIEKAEYIRLNWMHSVTLLGDRP